MAPSPLEKGEVRFESGLITRTGAVPRYFSRPRSPKPRGLIIPEVYREVMSPVSVQVYGAPGPEYLRGKGTEGRFESGRTRATPRQRGRTRI